MFVYFGVFAKIPEIPISEILFSGNEKFLRKHKRAFSENEIWSSENGVWNSEIEFQNSNFFSQNSEIEISENFANTPFFLIFHFRSIVTKFVIMEDPQIQCIRQLKESIAFPLRV